MGLVVLMIAVAASSLFIRTIRTWGVWSPIHMLSLFTLPTVPLAVVLRPPLRSGRGESSRDSVRRLNGKGSVPRSARRCVAGKVIEVGRPMWHERASLNSSIGMRCRF
jgi:hypothetical protein